MSHITNTTINFLKDLKQNNKREWFEANKKRYQASHNEVCDFAEAVLMELNKFDTIETESGKKSLYRIYRDIRFSKDKTPYKTNRTASFRRKGAERRGGYYLYISDEECQIGGGFYQPNAEDLMHIRKQIELDASPLKEVLNNKTFKSFYGELLGEKLKTAPKGFDKEDPNIELLRHKGFYVFHTFSVKEMMAKDFVKIVGEGYKKIIPFFDVMTDYLTTDLNGESII